MTTKEVKRLSGKAPIAVLLAVFGVTAAGCAGSAPGLGPAPQYLAAPTQEKADAPASEPQELADPYEKLNRSVLESNQKFNTSVIYPISDTYHDSVPEPVRDSISNFTSNLGEPAIFANDILQLRLKAAAATTGRFLINSTVGLGGIFDVASEQNIPKQTGDFGQTLYVWGVRESPYLVLPVLGPTNVRDAFGNGIEMVATSLPTGGFVAPKIANVINNVNNVGTVLSPFSDLDKVDDLRELEKDSLDFYSKLRSFVDQKRQSELKQALEESALSPPAAPVEPDYATEAIMTLHASPAWIEQPRPLEKKAVVGTAKGPDQPGSVTIGPIKQLAE